MVDVRTLMTDPNKAFADNYLEMFKNNLFILNYLPEPDPDDAQLFVTLKIEPKTNNVYLEGAVGEYSSAVDIRFDAEPINPEQLTLFAIYMVEELTLHFLTLEKLEDYIVQITADYDFTLVDKEWFEDVVSYLNGELESCLDPDSYLYLYVFETNKITVLRGPAD